MGTPTHFLVNPDIKHKGACNQREEGFKILIASVRGHSGPSVVFILSPQFWPVLSSPIPE